MVRIKALNSTFQLNVYQDASEMSSYLWRELSAATNYTFSVAACNHYTQECGRSSNVVAGKIMRYCRG